MLCAKLNPLEAYIVTCMKPIIGINCDYEEEGRYSYSFLYRNYSDAIIAAGGIPALLPVVQNKSDVSSFLKRIDGLLLTGGNDVPPKRYREEKHKKALCVHPDKDISDFTLASIAIEMKKPIFAICYGAQLINVSLGGSLIQDIPSEIVSAITHKDSGDTHYTHSVMIKKKSLLYKIIGTDHIETNSVHHQAVKRLGSGLKDSAYTSDGIIEAIEWETYPFFLGVQWHPERLIHSPYHLSLFSAFVNAAKYLGTKI